MSNKTVNVRRVWQENGFTCVVMENSTSTISSWYNAYIGVPENHIAANLSATDIPVKAHGGLTYGPNDRLTIIDENRDKDVVWYGWDYMHAGDMERNVDINEVVKECTETVKQFEQIDAKKIVDKKLELLPKKVTEKVYVKNHYELPEDKK